MTEERRLKLESMLDDAISTHDHDRIEAVERTIKRETLECTAHTATRIKTIAATVQAMDAKIDSLVASRDARKHRIEGAKMLASALKYLLAAGSGGAVVKVLFGG